ncbi:leucine-rich repeat domain-containing protein [Cytobacillus firmus]|uniref:leucine-rich repeat domain-containing protein n=1 Tax=Cytobacillus firmus TaxID=1399 RepID=UPI0024C208E0|nr:leucine-rich repeat domain-containing protein [Cytobacillus firmus]WHY33836.1 leucine-rich repeat domain-containing protein [Cytobacillus firmus]
MQKRKWLHLAVVLTMIFSFFSPVANAEESKNPSTAIDLLDPIYQKGQVILKWKTFSETDAEETFFLIKNTQEASISAKLISTLNLDGKVIKEYEYIDADIKSDQTYTYAVKKAEDQAVSASKEVKSAEVKDSDESQTDEGAEQASEQPSNTGEGEEQTEETGKADGEEEKAEAPTEEPSAEEARISFEDANLEKLIRFAIGKEEGAILKDDIAGITSLEINNSYGDITSLKGLENAVNLETLKIENVSVSDISVLELLSKLTSVKLLSLPVSNIDVLLLLSQLEKVEAGYLDLDLGTSSVFETLASKGVNVETLEEDSSFLLTAYRITESSAQISWGMYNRDTVEEYKLYVNGKLEKTLDGGVYEYNLSGLDASSAYEVKVEALKGGNLLSSQVHSFTTLSAPQGEKTAIADENLLLAIQEELGLERELYKSDLERLTSLAAPNMNIESLEGLEDAVNLDHLVIYGNQIQDLTPLAGLKKLIILDIGDNPITEASALTNLLNVANLDLSYTDINDFTFLKDLEKLQIVYLYGNLQIEEHAPSLAVIEALEAKGVEVYHDLQENVNLEIYPTVVSESRIGLEWDYWSEDEEDDSYPDQYVFIFDGKEEELSGDITSKTIGNLKPDTTYSFTVKAYENGKLIGRAALDVTTKKPPSGKVITFKDKNLEKAIKDSLGIDRDVQESDLIDLTNLDLGAASIKDLSGIEKAVNLESLSLWGNEISDLTPLSSLIKLSELDLDDNPISSLKPLAPLNNLTTLFLSNTNINDYSPLNQLENLNYLFLSSNGMTSIPNLSKLTKLEYLVLDDNSLTDLKGIESLRNLQVLEVSHNPVSDLSALSSLNLMALNVAYTDIMDLKWAKSLGAMQFLSIDGNNIEDLSPLAHLKNLVMLSANELPITDITVLLELPHLEYVSLYNNELLDLSEGSQAMHVIEELEAKGVYVEYGSYSEEGSLYFDWIDTTSTSIETSWVYEGEEDVTSYRIYLNEELVDEIDSSETSYTFEGLEPGTPYEITLEAYAGEEPVDYAWEYVWTASEDFYFTDLKTDKDSIEAFWTYEGEEEISGYDVYLDGEYIDSLDSDSSSYLFEELLPETSYRITVEALNDEGMIIAQASKNVVTDREEVPGEDPGESPGEDPGKNPGEDPKDDGDSENSPVPGKTPSPGGKSDPKPADKVKNTAAKEKKAASGSKLPNTATNHYNLLVMGLLTLLAASLLFIYTQRRKRV